MQTEKGPLHTTSEGVDELAAWYAARSGPTFRDRMEKASKILKILAVLVSLYVIMFAREPHFRQPSFEAKLRLELLASKITEFSCDANRCPDSLDELVLTLYAIRNDLIDPWGERYVYECSSDRIQVYIARPHGMPKSDSYISAQITHNWCGKTPTLWNEMLRFGIGTN